MRLPEQLQHADPDPHGPAASGHVAAAYLDAGQGPVYLVPGHRLTLGTAKSCDIVLDGPGIAAKHARVYLRPDGQLSVRPLGHRHLRLGTGLVRRPTPFAAGTTIGIGLHEIETGAASNHFYLHLLETWRATRRGLRTVRQASRWAAVSAAFHVLVLVLLLPVLRRQIGDDGNAKLGPLQLERQEDATALAEDIESSPEDPSLLEPDPELPELELTEPEFENERLNEDEPLTAGRPDFGVGGESRIGDLSGAELFANLTGKKRSAPKSVEDGKIGGHEIRNEKFARTVSRMRERGFEVVFAFDSTGSMSSTLSQAKKEMQKMLDLLLAVAPNLRVGIVTYRDQGDEYVTRTMELGATRYGTLAFLSSVTAGGGGDHPEAVDAALRELSRFRWRQDSIKAVVVIGDAPPHPGRPARQAIELAGRMRRALGRVHVVSTTSSREVLGVFEALARAGGGEVLRLADSRTLAKTLLSAALGTEAESDLDELLESGQLERPSSRPPRAALLRNLESTEPDPDIVEGWRDASRNEVRELLEELSRVQASPEGRMALVYLGNLWAERFGVPRLLSPEKVERGRGRLPRELREHLELLARSLEIAGAGRRR